MAGEEDRSKRREEERRRAASKGDPHVYKTSEQIAIRKEKVPSYD